jgi:hypothetical protein
MWAMLAATVATTMVPGSYGGGIVPTAAQANAGVHLALISLRVHPARQPGDYPVDLYVTTTVDCGRGRTYEVELRDPAVEVDDSGVIAYEDSGDNTYDNSGGTVDTTWHLDATYADGRFAGTLQVRATRRGKRCKAGSKSEWQARNPGVGANDAAALPGTPYFGVTSQVIADHYPAPIVLRTSGNGLRVEGAQWLVSSRCQKQHSDLFVNTTPKTAISGRAFARNERFSVRYVEGLIDFRARLAGGFTDAGASGTLRLREVWHRRGSDKRVTDRCDSGTITWSAAP